MKPHHLATVAGLHARRILDARALEASAHHRGYSLSMSLRHSGTPESYR